MEVSVIFTIKKLRRHSATLKTAQEAPGPGHLGLLSAGMQVSKGARSDISPEAFRILLFVEQMQCMHGSCCSYCSEGQAKVLSLNTGAKAAAQPPPLSYGRR